MSTWISRLAPVLLLGGCVGFGLGGETDRVTLTADQVTVVGPRGFCVDTQETRASSAVFGNCAALSGSRLTRQPDTPAILTAALSEPSEEGGIVASMDTLPAFFGSTDGAQVLSRTGDPDTVEVLQSYVAGDVFYLRASDSSPGRVPGVQDVYWRAYFDIGPRIATLSVLALDGETTDEAAQLNILESFVVETRAANALADAPGTSAVPDSPQQGLFNSGFFRRILG